MIFNVAELYDTVVTAGKFVANELKNTAEYVADTIKKNTDSVGKSLLESYETLASATSLGTLLLSDKDIESYFQNATGEYNLTQKIKCVKEYIKHNPIFKNIIDRDLIDINADKYYLSVSNGDTFESDQIYYKKEDNEYIVLKLNKDNFDPSNEQYYIKNISVYELDILKELNARNGLSRIYYGNLYNFMKDNIGKSIISYPARNPSKKRNLSLQAYMISPKIGYNYSEKEFLSLSETEAAYYDRLSALNLEKSFNSNIFKNIYYYLILSNKKVNIFNNDRVNRNYTFLEYGKYKNTIFNDYRDSLILASLNSAYNEINSGILDSQLNAFATKLIINMEKRHVEYLKEYRNKVDNKVSEVGQAIADYRALINQETGEGLSEAGNEVTSFNLEDIENGLSGLGETLSKSFTTYASNISNAATALFSDIDELNATISIDYSDLKDNDLCVYDTYLEYMDAISSDEFKIENIDNMALAEFTLLLFKFFSKTTGSAPNYRYIRVKKVNDVNALSYQKASSYDTSKKFYIRTGSTTFNEASMPAIISYTSYYTPGSNNSYFISNAYSIDKTYYTFSLYSSSLVSNTYYYKQNDGGLSYEVIDNTYSGDIYSINIESSVSLDNFTEYYYEDGFDFIKDNFGPLYLFDKTNNILKTVTGYLKIRSKLSKFFSDLKNFSTIYDVIYNSFSNAGNKFNVNNINIYTL